MRQFLNFTKDGGDLFLQLTFNAKDIAGTYTYTFWDKAGNSVLENRGRIMENVPAIALPSPAFMNDGAMLELNATIVGLVEVSEGLSYEVSAEVLQGVKALGQSLKVSKPLTEGSQVATLFVFLDMVDAEPDDNTTNA